jgi:hypothetical protein
VSRHRDSIGGVSYIRNITLLLIGPVIQGSKI